MKMKQISGNKGSRVVLPNMVASIIIFIDLSEKFSSSLDTLLAQ